MDAQIGLGDTCLDNDDCLLATRNSVCLDEHDEADGNQRTKWAKWASSKASRRRCRCSPGYSESSNLLECEPAPRPLVSLSSASSMSSHTQYDVITASTSADVTPNSDQTKLSQTNKDEESEQGKKQLAKLASSLGKPCSSGSECKRRDPNSDCIGGVCECSRPTSGCSSNSTGCHKDTFQCRNGQCISWYFVCDQIKNCDDGSDEQGCELKFACPPEAFQCLDGSCLTRAKVCNGKRECPDGSDEFQCSPGEISPSSVASLAVANWSSLAGGRGCHPRAFQCADGQCLPAYVFCNAVEDCSDGSDERPQLCERHHDRRPADNDDDRKLAARAPPPTGQPKPHDQSPLVKVNRESINKMLAALNLAPRTPASRGQRQARRRASREHVHADQPAECPRWAFTCRNGKCRSSAILCSGVDGCGDQSDEDHCEVCMCAPAGV